jgi:2-keto-4-pentenoate hydratase/2-oxohepta-3-ene-1,7-dioic acid hydratase in catechol pathway
LVSYRTDGPLRPGIELDGLVADVQRLAELAGWDPEACAELRSARAVVALGRERLLRLAETIGAQDEALAHAGALHARADVRLGPPVPDPQKIVCLGLNYRDHAAEAGLTAPAAPMFFAKYANSLVGPEDDIVPPATTRQVDYEAELAVVIGRRGRSIDVGRAMEHVAGAMAFNDVSARDLQLANTLWTGGKAIDTFAPCGPGLVLREDAGDLSSLAVRTRVNGRTVQDGNTASMIFGIAETIAFLSEVMTLEPGDIIATGTPAGVGNAREPKLFLRPGDLVEIEIERIGTLRNRVVEPHRAASTQPLSSEEESAHAVR